MGQYTDRAETAAVSAEADANSAATSAASASANAIKAETNATEVATYNFKNKITNCITEIPQDIKLELNDGVLTLKAGSKVYVPNGAGKFDEIVISTDVVCKFIGSGTNFLVREPNGGISYYSKTLSGSTAPTTNYTLWYDTANNIVKTTGSTTDINFTGCSLPFAKITLDNGSVTSIDQVFNGLGYIGSTIFALPGVKGLIPNGRNADGSLRNLEIINSKVKTGLVVNGNRTLVLTPSSVAVYADTIYHTESNINTNAAGAYQDCCHCGKVVVEKGVITSFTPKLPFRAVDQNDFNKLDEEVVKTSGDQTIGGYKAFTNPIRAKMNAVEENTPPAQNQYIDWITPYDKNGLSIGYLGVADYADGRRASRIGHTRNKSDGSKVYASIDVGTDKNGTPYSAAPTPPSGSNGTYIATTAWVRDCVKNTGGGANWASKVAVTRDANYTAPSNGYIASFMQFDDTSGILTINGVQIFNAGGNVVSPSFTFVPVSKGDVINIGGGAWQLAYFVPFK